jgi:hypothetical protein
MHDQCAANFGETGLYSAETGRKWRVCPKMAVIQNLSKKNGAGNLHYPKKVIYAEKMRVRAAISQKAKLP